MLLVICTMTYSRNYRRVKCILAVNAQTFNSTCTMQVSFNYINFLSPSEMSKAILQTIFGCFQPRQIHCEARRKLGSNYCCRGVRDRSHHYLKRLQQDCQHCQTREIAVRRFNSACPCTAAGLDYQYLAIKRQGTNSKEREKSQNTFNRLPEARYRLSP